MYIEVPLVTVALQHGATTVPPFTSICECAPEEQFVHDPVVAVPSRIGGGVALKLYTLPFPTCGLVTCPKATEPIKHKAFSFVYNSTIIVRLKFSPHVVLLQQAVVIRVLQLFMLPVVTRRYKLPLAPISTGDPYPEFHAP